MITQNDIENKLKLVSNLVNENLTLSFRHGRIYVDIIIRGGRSTFIYGSNMYELYNNLEIVEKTLWNLSKKQNKKGND